jgi:hypothetical protein
LFFLFFETIGTTAAVREQPSFCCYVKADMPTVENFLTDVPEDKEALKAMLRSLVQERDRQQ